MKILHRPVGQLGTNCFLLIDEETSCAALIDPGDNATQLAELVRANAVTLTHILLTHGHYDHTTAVPDLHAARPDAKIYIHEADANGAGSHLFPLAGQVPDLLLYDEGDELTMGDVTIQVLHTPGHSRGSVTLRVADLLFCGDTLFAGSCGRTDLPGGSYDQIMVSLKRLGQLEGDFYVCPGHDATSTLERERRGNPFLREALRN